MNCIQHTRYPSVCETVGFTIDNIAALLPDFGADPLLLGWLFHFTAPKDPAKPRTSLVNLSDIRMSEIRLVENNGVYRTVINAKPAVIKPLIHLQEKDPAFMQYPSTSYNYCRSVTKSYFEVPSGPHSDTPPRIDKLENYKCWADAAFIRATDLRLLKTYLQNNTLGGGFNEVFFSGARVDFSTMNNARLRLEQRYLLLDGALVDTTGTLRANCDPDATVRSVPTGSDPSKMLSKPYLDTSIAFTLKAEPIYYDANAPAPAFVSPTDGGNKTAAEETSAKTGDDSAPDEPLDSAEMMPAVFSMVPCPKYWALLQAIQQEAALATDNALRVTVPVSTANLQSLDSMIAAINNAPPPIDATSGTWLAELLRDLANAIDALFGVTP